MTMRNIKHIAMAAIVGLIAIAVGYGRQLPKKAPKCPQKAGSNIEYVYYKTKTVDGKCLTSAKVQRTDTLTELRITDPLMRKTLDTDIYMRIERLRKEMFLKMPDTLFFIIPMSADLTHLAVCEAAYMRKKANDLHFTAYYKLGKYTLAIEKSVAEAFGKPLGHTTVASYSYSWDEISFPYTFDPVVWYITRDYDHTVCIVSGPPLATFGGCYSVVY